jgi:hypothetical protein
MVGLATVSCDPIGETQQRLLEGGRLRGKDPQRFVDYERAAGPGGMSSPSRPIHPGEEDRGRCRWGGRALTYRQPKS